MQFMLALEHNFYSEIEKNALEKLGFQFELAEDFALNYYRRKRSDGILTIDINTIEEFVSFVEKWGNVEFNGNTIYVGEDRDRFMI